MRYLVKAIIKPGREHQLLTAIDDGTLGQGSVAGDEYQRDMKSARLSDTGIVSWVEICYCSNPLNEERPYWEEYFDLVDIKDAHARKNCRDDNGTEPRACGDCDCTDRLEENMAGQGREFTGALREQWQ